MLLALILVLALAALVAASCLLYTGMKSGAGTLWMPEFSEGAGAALAEAVRQRASTLIPAALGAAAIIFFSLFFFSSRGRDHAAAAAFSFLVGACLQAAAAFFCFRISAAGILRTAAAEIRSGPEPFTPALRMAGASSIMTQAAGLAGVSGLLLLTGGWNDARAAVLNLSGFCFGTAFTALFLRLSRGSWGGGAAPGAAGFFRDRTVGVALLSSDALDSSAAESVSAMILGASLWPIYGAKAVVFPLFARVCGLAACAAGVMTARQSTGGGYAGAPDKGLAAAGAAALSGLFLGCVLTLDNNIWLFTAAVTGLVSASLFVFSSRHYGEDKPCSALPASGNSCSGGNHDSAAKALSAGFESAVLPSALTAAALVGAYYCGVRGLENYCAAGALGERACGLYGIVMAVIGALSVSGYVLALGVFGSAIAGARNICEMIGHETVPGQECAPLDSAGRSWTAASVGYAGASAVLAALLLLSAYMSGISRLTGLPFEIINFAGVEGLAGGFLGTALLAAFCAFSLGAKAPLGIGSVPVIKRVLLTSSPALVLPAAALAFRSSGQGPEIVSAMLISVIVCGGFVSAFIGNTAAVSGNPRTGEASLAVNALMKLLPAMALALSALFVQ